MPVILEDEFVDDWLYVRQSSSSLLELLRPAREDLLIGTPVSTRVNSVKNDDPLLVANGSTSSRPIHADGRRT